MTDLIKIENGKLAKETIDYIIKTEKAMKSVKEQYDNFKAELLLAMEKSGVIKLDSDEVMISYVAPTESERLDSKALKENCPELYNEFVKFTPVKASVRIKIK